MVFQVAKKLAGHAQGTAAWATNIGNEYGQVLMSVLTASEGLGLGTMIEGLVDRYATAQVPPPDILYVDRGCCENSSLKRSFALWPDLIFRLDIWHFMRRFASCVTTEAHPLYSIFMNRLAKCIFEWNYDDISDLKRAKRAELISEGIASPSDETVQLRVTKKELALHCRRSTRGREETSRLLHELLTSFTGDDGKDTLGTPLFDEERVWDEWRSQRKHISCIQDPDGYQLYSQTGTLVKGGVTLPTYRCARGSVSLESFHLHLNRFIPGQYFHYCNLSMNYINIVIHLHFVLSKNTSNNAVTPQRDSQYTAKMKANAVPRFLSSLV